MASAGVLLAGLGVTVSLATRAFRPETNAQHQRTSAAMAQRDFLADLQLATQFTERTATAVAFSVPDRDNDGRPETLRYAWSGVIGTPLTLAYNGAAPTTVLPNVRTFALNYKSQTVNGVTLPAEQTGSAVLLVVNDSKNPTSEDLARKSMIESWNFVVTMIGLNDDPGALFDAAGAVQAVYISATVEAKAFDLASKLAELPVGIVSEHVDLIDEFGFGASTASQWTLSLSVNDASHYITSSLGKTSFSPTILGSTASFIDSNPAAQLNALASLSKAPALATIDAKDLTYDGGNAAGRRVFLPWASASFDPLNLSEAGRMLTCKAIEWATGLGDDSANLKTFGYDQVFASSGSKKVDVQLATKAILEEPGKVVSISAYVGGAAAQVRFAIYSDNKGQPGGLLVQSNTGTTSNAMQWVTLDVTETALGAGTYWLAFAFANSSQKYAYVASYTNGGERNKSYAAVAKGFIDSWGSSNNSYNGARSIYATYKVVP